MNRVIIKLWHFLPVILYMIVCIVPSIARRTSRGMLLAVILLLIVTALSRKVVFDKKLVLYFFLFIVYLFLEYYRVSYISSVGNFYESILFFFPIIYVSSVNNKISNSDKLFIITIFMIVQTYVAVENITLLIKQPYLSKYLTGGVEYVVSEYGNTNLGGVSSVFISVCVALLCIITIKKTEGILYKFFHIVVLILNCVFVIMARSTICFLFLFVGVFLELFFYEKNRSKAFLISAFLLSIIVIILFSGGIRVLLDVISLPDEYENRLRNIVDWLSQTNSIDSLSYINGRFGDYFTSIKTFITHPIAGVGMIYSVNVSVVGMHSEFLDFMARYGLIGIGIIVLIFRRYLQNDILKNAKAKALFTLVLLYSLFNPMVSRSIGFTVFFILFLFINVTYREDKIDDIVCIQ